MIQLAKVVIVLLGIGLGVLISYALIAQAETIVYQAPSIEIEQKVEQQPESKAIQIEISYTKERIIEKVRQAFLDAPIMLEVAKCESQYKITAHNTTLNTDGTTDGGIFQLNSIHDEELTLLGLNKFDPEDNIKFARILYDRSGLRPWNSSKDCWGKHIAS